MTIICKQSKDLYVKGTWIRKPTHGCTIVFIHGVLSSGDTCWRHKNGSYWPEILAAETGMQSVGIYEFSYKTGLFSGTYRLGDVVDSLKEHLGLDGVLESKGIVFVCHSMGGIVARKFIVERATTLVEKDISLGLFLLASPSLGSHYANLLTPLAKILGHSQGDALRFSQNNSWLADLDREFMNAKEGSSLRIVGKELVEDNFFVLKTLFKKQVVQAFSGARYFGEPFKVPDSDHFSIVKLADNGAVQHRLLLKFIQEHLDEASSYNQLSSHSVKQAVKQIEDDELLADVCKFIKEGPFKRINISQTVKYLMDVKHFGEDEARKCIDLWIVMGDLNKVSANRLEVPSFVSLRKS